MSKDILWIQKEQSLTLCYNIVYCFLESALMMLGHKSNNKYNKINFLLLIIVSEEKDDLCG